MNVCLQKKFSCGHLYENKKWTPEKNLQKFGKCYSPHGHGHDYTLKVTFELNQYDDSVLQKINQQLDQLIQSLDHKHLNFDIPEFKTTIPTTEEIALYLQKKIQSLIENPLKRLQLKEGLHIWSEIVLD